MMGKARRKLHQSTGASLMVALLVFLICATVGSVILAAAASSAGRTSKADTDANIQRYSLEDAASVIVHDIIGDPDSEEAGLSIDLMQEWSVHRTKADYAVTGNPTTVTINGTDYISTGSGGTASLYSEGQYITNPSEQVTYGDWVLARDQKAATGTDQYPTYPQLKDPSTTFETNSWSNEWTGTIEGEEASGDYSNYISVDTSGGSSKISGTQSSLQNVVILMAEGIYRNYWYAINDTTAVDVNTLQTGTYTVVNPLTADSDPLKDQSTGDVDWSTVTARQKDYSIGTKESNPLTIKVKEQTTDLYPVYADVTMDKNGRLKFDLYCGSKDGGTDTRESVEGNPDLAASHLYLVFEPENGEPSLSYDESTSSSQRKLDSIYIETKSGQIQNLQSEDELKNLYNGQDVILHVTNKEAVNDDEGQFLYYKFTYDIYTSVTPTQRLTVTNRSWIYSISWNQADVETTDPDE